MESNKKEQMDINPPSGQSPNPDPDDANIQSQDLIAAQNESMLKPEGIGAGAPLTNNFKNDVDARVTPIGPQPISQQPFGSKQKKKVMFDIEEDNHQKQNINVTTESPINNSAVEQQYDAQFDMTFQQNNVNFHHAATTRSAKLENDSFIMNGVVEGQVTKHQSLAKHKRSDTQESGASQATESPLFSNTSTAVANHSYVNREVTMTDCYEAPATQMGPPISARSMGLNGFGTDRGLLDQLDSIDPTEEAKHDCSQEIGDPNNFEADSVVVSEDMFEKYDQAKTNEEKRAIQRRHMTWKTACGQIVSHRDQLMIQKNPKVKPSELPRMPLDNNDLRKRIGFPYMKDQKVNALSDWKQKDAKGIRKNGYIKEIQKKNERILSIVDKSKLEQLEVYHDLWPLLKCRKSLWKCYTNIHLVANKVITNSLFENISITIIMLNCVVMMSENPADPEPPELLEQIDQAFLVLYSIEMICKILGYGFILGPDAYLKDSWNILDFVIVTSGYLTLMTEKKDEEVQMLNEMGDEDEGGGIDLAGLRVFRVMRPLKTVSSVKGLKVLMQALMSAIPLLKDTVIILGFFFLIMSIAGCQLLTGNLKHRCISIQTGKQHEDELICGYAKCPGGYFCGKSNDNPNYGVTNFDNLMYSFLVVFQSVTLEGWSDVQKQMQNAYTYLIFMYFLPLVFIGAFFLLNLMLAVINSKFTEAHHEQQAKDEAAKSRQKKNNKGDDFGNMNLPDEMSISQFFAARKCSGLMIKFLRHRQEYKAQEMLKSMEDEGRGKRGRSRSKNKAGAPNALSRGTTQSFKSNSKKAAGPLMKKTTFAEPKSRNKIVPFGQAIDKFHNITLTTQQTFSDIDGDYNNEFNKEVNQFIEKQTLQLHEEGYIDFEQIQQVTQELIKTDQTVKRQSASKNRKNKQSFGQAIETTVPQNNFGYGEQKRLTMKRNLGLQKKFTAPVGKMIPKHRKKRSQISDIAMLDLDNVIPLQQQLQPQIESAHESMELANLSEDNQEQGRRKGGRFRKMNKFDRKFDNQDDPQKQQEFSIMISSDSEFDTMAQRKHQHHQVAAPTINAKNQALIKYGGIEEVQHNDLIYETSQVSRTFKKMLSTSNRMTQRQLKRQAEHQNGGRRGIEKDIVFNAQMKNKWLSKKIYEGDQFKSCVKVQDHDHNPRDRLGKYKNFKDFQRPLFKENNVCDPEKVSTKAPLLFEGLDEKTQKVGITPGVGYVSASQIDVFQQRAAEENQDLDINQFLKPIKVEYVQDQKDEDQKKLNMPFVPYMQKYMYQCYQDSSSLGASDKSENDEDHKCSQQQPYETVSQINYSEFLKQVPLKELSRRSDILITSTISLSMFPKDNRLISRIFRAEMEYDEIQEFVDEKNTFKAMCKQHSYRAPYIRDKDKEFRDNYIKSFIHGQNFETDTFQIFKENVKTMNRYKKAKQLDKAKSRLVLKAEQLKHKQNVRASQKRGLPTFNFVNATQLLEGKYHEQDEDENEPGKHKPTLSAPKIINQKDLQHHGRLKMFESLLPDFDTGGDNAKREEIPKTLRDEFLLPKQMGEKLEVNFQEIRQNDHSSKKFHFYWSGQDVLPDYLNNEKSQLVVNKLNEHRVWPVENRQYWKRIRYVLRKFVKSSFFDNSMTFAVLLNTIVLSIDHYGIVNEVERICTYFNDRFTEIFIFEMSVKLLALGVTKYCDDRMNWLDGSVVTISVFELVFIYVQGDSANLAAFATIRMFRTFRVFRIARLLRALESMQTIIDVISKSYQSFIYITLLMSVFIFIFSLLGMQLFGGQFDYPDGKPRGNYDKFSIACITVFQILTMENWIFVCIDSLRGDLDPYLVCAYYMAWIAMGNFILLNLFLAILLDSFLEEDDGEDDDLEELNRKRQEKLRKIELKKLRQNRNKVLMGNKKIKQIALKQQVSEEDLEDLDEIEIEKIYRAEGLFNEEKKESEDEAGPEKSSRTDYPMNNQPEEEEDKMYVGIECQAAFYIFDKENCLRIRAYKLMQSKIFDNTVLFLIGLSSLKLASDTYSKGSDKESLAIKISENVDYVFNYSFIFEMITKLIAMGFIMDEGSYLRESWNQLDFFIVMASIADMSLSGSDIKSLKVLRLLRTLRPLRVISHNVALKMIVVALLESVGGIINVSIVVGVSWLIFAILGVNLFGGKFQYCSVDMLRLHIMRDCEFAGGQWMTYDHHFDNVPGAMRTLFVVSSLEGWPDVMLQAVDATAVEKGPKEEASIGNSLFFVIFIMIGSFFFLNFFIGVLFLKYNHAQKEEQKGYSAKDLSWQDIQRLILSSTPVYETTNIPKQKWRQKFHALVSGNQFDIIIMSCIVLNMVQMAVDHEGMTPEVAFVLKLSNYIFTLIFFTEAVLKLVAFGSSYFKNGWNKFDFFVVVSSIFDVVLDNLDTTSLQFLSVGPQIARVMRVLRVTRIIRLAGKAEGLQAIIQTIMFSIPSLVNVFLLLMLIFFMFAVLGVFMFGDIMEGDVIDDMKNFNDFGNAFLLLFAVSTGEDWNKVMFDCSRTEAEECIPDITCGTSMSYMYFYGLVLICSHVMLNLFILVIIQQFEKYYLPKENMITLFKIDVVNFMEAWKYYTQDRYKCFKIKEKQLLNFFRKLGEKGDKESSLGFSSEFFDEGDLKKQILKMGIKSENGFVYFNELLYRCMRRKYGNYKISRKMQIFELRTQYQIYIQTLEAQGKMAIIKNEDFRNSIIRKGNNVNPFLTEMNFKISWKTWYKFAKLRRRQNAMRLLTETGDGNVLNKDIVNAESQTKFIEVEIEVEQYESHTTSDEESEEKSREDISPQRAKSQKATMNHLELFQKKMTRRFAKSNKDAGKMDKGEEEEL